LVRIYQNRLQLHFGEWKLHKLLKRWKAQERKKQKTVKGTTQHQQQDQEKKQLSIS